jgi:hypothetical protein
MKIREGCHSRNCSGTFELAPPSGGDYIVRKTNSTSEDNIIMTYKYDGNDHHKNTIYWYKWQEAERKPVSIPIEENPLSVDTVNWMIKNWRRGKVPTGRDYVTWYGDNLRLRMIKNNFTE